MALPSLRNFEVFSPLPRPLLPRRSFAVKLLERLNGLGSRSCFITESGDVVTYGDVARRAVAVALHLKAIGVRPERTVCVLTGNAVQLATAILGCLLHSTTVILACNSRHATAIVAKHKPAAFLFEKSAPLRSNADPLAYIEDTLCVALESIECEGAISAEDFCAPPYRGSIVTPSLVLFSGGSGGPQRGVILPDKWLHYLLFLQDYGGESSLLEHREDDVLLLTGPLWRTPGVVTLVTGLAAGCSFIVQRNFDPEQSFRLIERFRVTGLPLLARSVSEMAASDSMANYDLSSVRFLLNFSGPLCSRAWQTFKQRTGINYVRQVYSLSESLVSTCRTSEPDLTNVGPPLPGMRVKMVQGGTGEKSSLKVNGTIWIDGESMFLGFLEGLTQRQMVDKEGWYCTGDLGHYDERGNIHVLDREEDTFTCQRDLVTPAEIEHTLGHHPAVRMAAVIGVPVAKVGEAARAFVVPVTRPEDPHSEGESIRAYLRLRYPYSKQLHGGVEFIRKLPLTEVGRPIRRVLRDLYLSSRQEE